MNIWHLSGEVLGYKKIDSKFPRMWLRVALDVLKVPDNEGNLKSLEKNVIFLNAQLDDADSPGGRASRKILSDLETNSFVLATGVYIAPLSRSRKKEDGTWEEFKERGLKVNVKNLTAYKTRPMSLNTGQTLGKVLKQKDNAFIIEDRYRIPSSGEWASREVPVLCSQPVTEDLVGRQVFVPGSIAGTSLKGESKIYVVSNSYFKTLTFNTVTR